MLNKIIKLKCKNRDLSKKIKHINKKITMFHYEHSDFELYYPYRKFTDKQYKEYLTWHEEVNKLLAEMKENSFNIIHWRSVK